MDDAFPQVGENVANEPIPFADSPAVANTGLIDYRTKTGAEIYKLSTQPFRIIFDLVVTGLNVFLEQVRNRALDFGWGDILLIPKDMNDIHNTVDLLNHYGEVSLQQVRAHAESYLNPAVSRAAQDSKQLYSCLIGSLSAEAMDKVLLRSTDYIVAGRHSGVALLKVIIEMSHIDTNATARILKEKLAMLPKAMVDVDYNVESFNMYVTKQVRGLAARGIDPPDLLGNLFSGYKAAVDRDFVDWVKRKSQDYDAGEDLQPELFMKLAQNMYQTAIEDGTWNAPSPEQSKIIAMEAEIASLRKKKQVTPNSSTSGTDNARYNSDIWFTTPPKSGEETKPKTRSGKEYWWCVPRKKWCRHKPEECRNAAQPRAQNATSNDQTDTRRLQLSQALANVAEADNHSDDE